MASNVLFDYWLMILAGCTTQCIRDVQYPLHIGIPIKQSLLVLPNSSMLTKFMLIHAHTMSSLCLIAYTFASIVVHIYV